MAGLNKDAASPAGPVCTEEPTKNAFDVPIRMRIRDVQELIEATLLHVAGTRFQLHSLKQLDPGTPLSFEWHLSDGTLLNAAGVVAERYTPREEHAGFEYEVAIEAMSDDQAHALEHEAEMLINYRVPDDVIVSYRIDNPRRFGIGGASDITRSSLRLLCNEPLEPNEAVHLALRLRRPFEEIQLRGRVVSTVKDSKRRDAYEIELRDLNDLARQELARYIHASQLSRIKK